ncbi:uncharacterized protein I206_105234 [Kwoniella pini CBS 10737]|uniref:AFG1 family mitochondrial ATPase n=1 Tax=Kwoniella pini CBS 10737 TaxID=1296096 RepID=A0A1B9I4T4_9TREE|nr:AFG1 family mitochondrial ATPase [Kwoniella pini CBS 10737]OCF50532.1 AFG1 family mitochondrial ATPase [Kwoniella pini CBS 10737]
MSYRSIASTRNALPRPARLLISSPPRKQVRPFKSTIPHEPSIARRKLHSTSRRRDDHVSPPHNLSIHAAEAKASFSDPMTRYSHLVQDNVLRADENQKVIIGKLQRLWEDLEHYDPGPIRDEPEGNSNGGFLSRLFGRSSSSSSSSIPLENVPKGLYLYGSVGTGKTMLMDLFHSTLPSQFRSTTQGGYGSTRIHFHSFMLDVLQKQHEVTLKYLKKGLNKDSIPEVARMLAEKGRVLCFDEFQVTDIVTAMLLRQLLEKLMSHGVVCVMTSNRHPDELYLNGIQRESFIPAIELIKDKFEIVDLDSGTDYRKLPRALSKVYFSPLNLENKKEMSKLFQSFCSNDPTNLNTNSNSNEIILNKTIPLWGRNLIIPESSGSIAKFKFSDLCNKPLSSADYLEITGRFGTVFIENVPKLGLSERDQARRFITFIDACYENRTKIFISSEVPIFQIFSDKHGSEIEDEHMKSVIEELGLNSNDIGSSSLFQSDEELFAFARCVSRLNQMGTKEWSETTWQEQQL